MGTAGGAIYIGNPSGGQTGQVGRQSFLSSQLASQRLLGSVRDPVSIRFEVVKERFLVIPLV